MSDQDAFTLDLAPFETVTVLTSHAPGQGYTDATLFSPDGSEIASSLDPSTGVALEALAEEPGPYTLVLDPYAVTGAAGLPYDLAILVD
jgi:hypothetical protein